MSHCYAGIGSRETPASVQARFFMLASTLGDAGWTLRSGGAEGADAAFERGLAPHHLREIYLPWPRFAGNRSALCIPTPEALELAAQFHPAWERCSSAARRLHARNMHQVLGQDLATPVEFVACWTPDGRGGGGTGQALRLARAREIPIFDFGQGPQVYHALQDWLQARDDALRAEKRARVAPSTAPPGAEDAAPDSEADDCPETRCSP